MKYWLRGMLCIGALCLGVRVFATDFDHVLVPVIPVFQQGAYGSEWNADLLVRNDGDVFYLVSQEPNASPCQLPECPVPESPPHSTLPVIARAAIDGALIYLEHSGAPSITLHLRIQDVSRQALTWGTEVPVVRATDTFSEPFSLLDIPTDSRFRSLLRIYEFDGLDGTVVHIKVFPLDSEQLLAEADVTLHVFWDARTPPPDRLPMYPASARVDLVGTFPQVRPFGQLRVVISPVSQGSKIWAFVSVVNNDSQHLTIITPDTGSR